MINVSFITEFFLSKTRFSLLRQTLRLTTTKPAGAAIVCELLANYFYVFTTDETTTQN